MTFTSPVLLGATQAVRLHALTFDPAFSPFLLILLCGLTGVLIFYLYREQQKIAPARIVHWLTGIRLSLVALLLLLLLRPLRQWVNTRNAGGTLWVLVDQSLSMKQIDQQASDLEKLRWADALGELPPNLRAGKIDRCVARLTALRDDLRYLHSQAELPSDADAERSGVSTSRALRLWLDRLGDLTSVIRTDAQGSSADADATAVAASLQELSGSIAEATSQSPISASKIPWRTAQSTLTNDVARLQAVADRIDADFLAQHAADAPVRQALLAMGRLQRSDLAYAALTRKSGQEPASLASLLEAQETRIATFAGTGQALNFSDPSKLPEVLKTAFNPVGNSTNVAGALKFVSDQLGGGDPASVLLVSDGRSNDGGDVTEPARQLAARGARIFTLTVGSRRVVCDAAVESIDAPEWIYKDDTLRASALLRLDGLANKTCTVELRRGADLIDTQNVLPTSNHAMQVVTFRDTPPDAGLYDYEIRVKAMPEEAVLDNNRQSFRLSVKSDKLHALIVEDQPRWEYRYLSNFLSRDNRVQLQTVLLEPARVAEVVPPQPVKASATNATSTAAQILPQTQAEWSGFDLIVLGDVPVESLSPTMQQNLAAAVRDRGTTLLIIAGPQNMPGRFAGSPLAELLPIYLNNNWTATAIQNHLRDGFRPVISPEGTRSILSQFGLEDAANGQLWAAAPRWYWHSQQTQAKLSASVIWSIGEDAADNGATNGAAANTLAAARQNALLCTMSVGLGRVMYLASDSTWRLRQVSGQNLHERFWGQFIRWVVGSDLPAGGKLVRFGTNKPRYANGESVQVSARVMKEDLTPLAGQKFKVAARVPKAAPDSAAGKLMQDADMQDSPDAPGFYRGTLSNLPAGPLELSLEGVAIDPLVAHDSTAASHTLKVEVLADANLEMQNINADHHAMEQIAEAGGGVALDAPYFNVLADHIPNLRHDQTTIEQAGLFTDPKDPWTRRVHWGFLILFVTLITSEWILRKAGGLV